MKNNKKLKTALIVFIVILALLLCFNVGVYAAYALAATEVSYKKPGTSTTISVKDALDELNTKVPKVPEKSIGDEVTVGGEKFYVLEWDNNSDIALLLAKYNLNNTDYTSQLDAGYGSTRCLFSSKNLWSSEASYPLNLNDYYGYSSNDALAKAKNYGRIKGAVSSRLLSYEEANELKTKAKSDTKIYNMLWGKANSVNKFLNYWLGSASDTDNVWYVYGFANYLYYTNFDNFDYFGVRPVITVLKSKIS